MITLSLLMLVLFVGGIFYLGASLVFAIIALAFKALWFGLNFIFSLGWLAVAAVAAALVLFIKLSGVFILVAAVAAGLWIFWMLGKLFSGTRRPAPSYAYEPPRGAGGWGGSQREETLRRLHRTLGKMEQRMRDLEDEMERRWR